MRPPERPAAQVGSAPSASARRPTIPPSRKPDGGGWWCAIGDELEKRRGTCHRTRASCERGRPEGSPSCSPRNTAACFAILNTRERLCFVDPERCEQAVKLLPEEMPLSRCEVGS